MYVPTLYRLSAVVLYLLQFYSLGFERSRHSIHSQSSYAAYQTSNRNESLSTGSCGGKNKRTPHRYRYPHSFFWSRTIEPNKRSSPTLDCLAPKLVCITKSPKSTQSRSEFVHPHASTHERIDQISPPALAIDPHRWVASSLVLTVK